MAENKEQSCFLQLRLVKNTIDDLIIEERKQIEDAFLHGKRDGLLNVHEKPESFYNSRYNK